MPTGERQENPGSCLQLDSSNDVSFVLDVLRIVASALVVIGHAIGMFHLYPAFDYPRAPYMQNIAVVVFFVVSGFLITHTIRKGARRPDYSFARYAIGRWARIYSGFVPAIVFVAIVDAWLQRRGAIYQYSNASGIRTFLANLLMLQDFPMVSARGSFGWLTSFGSARPFWTLAIEVWIYLFVGAVVLLRRPTSADGSPASGLRYSPRALLLIGALSIVPIWNLFGGRGHGLFGAWLLGAAIEYVLFSGLLRDLPRWLLAAAALFGVAGYSVIVWSTKDAYQPTSYPFLFIALTFVLEMAYRTSWSASRRALRAVVTYGASYSYTLYLVHYTVLVAVLASSPSRSPGAMWISIAVCNVVALVIAHGTERHHRLLARALERRLLRAA